MDTDRSIDFPSPSILDEEPPPKPKSDLACYIGLLLYIILGFSLALGEAIYSLREYEKSPIPKKATFEDSIQLILKPHNFEIPVSSLEERTFSMRARVEAYRHWLAPPREPIDLVSVVDFPDAEEKYGRWSVHPGITVPLYILGDKDRFSIVVVDQEASGNSSDYETPTIVPLNNATRRNRWTIFYDFSPGVLKERSNKTLKGLRTAIDLLNERRNSSPITGIMLFSSRCNQEEINYIFKSLTPQNEKAFLYCLKESELVYNPDENYLRQNLKESLTEIKESVFGTVEYFIEPVQSKFFQEIEIVKAESEKPVWGQDSPKFISRNLSLFPARQNDFLVDVKVGKITNPQRLTKGKVKIATCKMVLTLLNGQQVVKNEDITVEIL